MTQAVTATGQVAHDAGMSFEQLAAISAKVAERTREDGSSIGNAMKTIITRISKVNKMPQYADEIDSGTVSKASESLAAVGVQVYKPSGEMNDMITILSQLREKWDSLSDAQQANIAFNIAATRQTSKFKNILMAWTDSMELAEHATNAQGGALENQEKYEESIAGKTQKIRTELDAFWIDLYNSDATKGILDFVINLAEGFNELADAVGPVKALLGTIFGGVALKGIGGGLLGMMNAGSGIKSFSDIFSGAHAADIFRNTFGKNAAEWGKYDFGFVQNQMMQKFPAQQELFASATSTEQLAAASIRAQQASAALFKQMLIGAGVVAAITVALYGLKKVYDATDMSTESLIKRNQHMLEIDQKKTQALKDEKTNYDNQASSLQNLLDQYNQAEYGSQEYYNIRKQIADQFPTLIVGYDSEGQAIIANNDAIQSQIEYYQELSQAKQKALTAQAETTINRETGSTNEFIGGFSLEQTGNSSLLELKKQQRAYVDQLERMNAQKGEKVQTYKTTAKGDTIYTGTVIRGSDEDEAYAEVVKNLEDVTNQIEEAQNNLQQAYAFLVSNITTEDEQLIGALQNLEKLATLIGTVDVDQFQDMLLDVQSLGETDLTSLTELMDSILRPDLNEIPADKYLSTMQSRLSAFAQQIGLTEEQWAELSQTLGINARSREIDKKLDSFLTGTFKGKSNREIALNLGIDLETELSGMTAADVLGLNSEKFFSEKAEQKYAKEWKKQLQEISPETIYASDLMKIDWENSKPITAEQTKEIGRLIDEYDQALEEAAADGVDLSQNLFGNINLNARQIAKDAEGNIETVLGGWETYDGIPIAFSPLLQTPNGPEELGPDTINNYIWGLIDHLGDNWTTEDLLALDAQAKDWTDIRGIIADVGDTAEQTSKQMHLIEAVKFSKEGLTDYLNTPGQFLSLTDSAIKSMAQTLQNAGLADSFEEAIDILVKWGLVAGDTAQQIEDQFSEFKTAISTDLTAFATSVSSVNTALSEMQKNGNVTRETYEALIATNEGYKDALVESSSGMQLNVDKLQEIKRSEEQVLRTKLRDELTYLANAFQNQTEEIEQARQAMDATTDASVRLAKQTEITNRLQTSGAIEQSIQDLKQLQAELDASTSKYKQWQDAISNGTSADQYDTIRGWKDTFDEMYKQGRVGDESFEAFVSMFTGKTGFSFENSAGQYYDMISKFIQDYFTEDFTGPDKMYDDIMSAIKAAGLDSWIRRDEQGNELGWDIKNYDVLRHALTDYLKPIYGEDFEVTSELMEIFGKAMKEFGIGDPLREGSYTMDVEGQRDSLQRLTAAQQELIDQQADVAQGGEAWQELQRQIEEYQKEIDRTTLALKEAELQEQKLGTQADLSANISLVNSSEAIKNANNGQGMQIDVPMEYESVKQAEANIQSLQDAKRELLDSEGELLDPNEEDTLNAINALLEHAIAAKQELIQPATLDIEVSDVASETGIDEGTVQKYKDKLQQLFDTMSQQEHAINIGDVQGVEEASKQIQGLQDDLRNIDQTGELSKAFDIDTGSLDDVYQKLYTVGDNANKSSEEVNELGEDISTLPQVGTLGFPLLNSYIKTAKDNVSSLGTQIDNLVKKDHTITIKVKQQSANGGRQDEENGTLQKQTYQGTASFAHGTWSLGGKAAARGDIGAKKTETSLVGELGPEIRVRGSKWELLGQNGAEFTDVRKGDIIFNHRQSAALLKGQHINSRGKLIADKVYEDKVYGDGAYVLGTSGSAYGNPGQKPDRKTPSSPKNPKNTDGGGKNHTGTDDSSSDKKEKKSAIEKFKEALENIVDWIEIKISRQTDRIDHYISKAEQKLDRKLFGQAATNYKTALKEIFTQINYENRGGTDYMDFAAQQMQKAIKQSLISKKDAEFYMKRVQEGYIGTAQDIQQFVKGIKAPNGNELNKKEAEQLTELISLYKEWYDKGYEAKKALEELTEQAREQVKALKELRDAERDAKIDRKQTLLQISTGGFESTSDGSAKYSNNQLLRKSIDALNTTIKQYAKATDKLYKDVFGGKKSSIASQTLSALKTLLPSDKKIKDKKWKKADSADVQTFSKGGKTANFTAIGQDAEGNQVILKPKQLKKYAQDVLANKRQDNYGLQVGKTYSYNKKKSKIKKSAQAKAAKEAKRYRKYLKVLGTIEGIIKSRKKVPEKTLNIIEQYNPNLYARLLSYNQGVDEVEASRLEEAANYAESQSEKYNNRDQKFSNRQQAFENRISLYGNQKENAIGYSDQNSLINQQMTESKNIVKNAGKRAKYWFKQVDKITTTMDRNTDLAENAPADEKKRKQAKTAIDKATKAASKGKPINNIQAIADFYAQGYITRNFYRSCIRYNEALEHRNEAEWQKKITEETEKHENHARMLEKVQNIATQAEQDQNSKMASNNYARQEYNQSNKQQTTLAQSRISMAETQGHYADVSDYEKQIQMENRNIAIMTKARDDMIKSFNKSVKKNPDWIGTEEYYSAVDAINEMNNSIDSSKQSIVELGRSIRELNWQKFDDGMAAVKRFNTEVNHYANLLGNETLFDVDNKGLMTDYGAAMMDLRNANYESYIAQAQMYSNELNDIYAQIESGALDATDKDVISRIQTLTDAVWESTEAAEAEKQALIDLVRQGYEAQLSHLNTTISKYKELKDAEKEAYDYQKQISESTKNITNLEKQLAAFEGNTSEEAVAKVQKLRADLKEARESREDQQYEKYLSDSQKLLDNISNNFQEWIEQHMKDRDLIIQEAKEALAGKMEKLGTISAKTIETLKNVDSHLGNKIDNVNGADTLTSVLETAFSNALGGANGTTIGEQLQNIYNVIVDTYSKQQSNQAAATTVESAIQGLSKKRLTINDAKAVQQVRADYDALSKEEKKYVSKESVQALKTAEKQIKALQEAEKAQKIQDLKKQLKQAREQYDNATVKVRTAEAEFQSATKTKEKDKWASQVTKAHTAQEKAEDKVIELEKQLQNLGVTNYKTGSRYIKMDQQAWTQENGGEVIYRKSDGAVLTPLGKGDKVFTSAMSENLWKIAQMNIPDMINGAMSQPIVQNANQNINQSVGDINFVFNLPNVSNYDQFKSQLVADKQFQSALQEMTLGAAMGRNSLSKYKYAN